MRNPQPTYSSDNIEHEATCPPLIADRVSDSGTSRLFLSMSVAHYPRSFVHFNTLVKQQARVQDSQGTSRRAAGTRTARKEKLKPEVKANHKRGRAYKL